MLDKISGKKKGDKDTPKLRSNGKKKSDSDMGGRLKGMMGRVTGRKDTDKKDQTKAPPEKKMPRPMPKPMAKPGEKARLKPPKKPESKKPGLGAVAKGAALGGFGRRGGVPDDDQRTLVGAAVLGLIIVILVGAGYYFLVYAPYQTTLGEAKQTKIDEINTYFTGPLATDPQANLLRAQVDSKTTPEEVLLIDVLGPATDSWRTYQTNQIKNKTDNYGRVMITYAAGDQKNVIIKAVDAQTIVTQSDASVLSNMEIETPDTVAIPIIISRLQAAGGLINVGNSVDIYLMNQTETQTTNETNQTTQVSNETAPKISGATVLAILRARDSGTVEANMSHAQSIAINELIQSSSRGESASGDVEQLLRAAASRNWDESVISSTLNQYGWRLSDFERTSNLGELDAQYLLLLEVPREDAIFLIRNMNNVILTVPTQKAPSWMVTELRSIYGSG